jgi:hypothetical protein
MFCYRVLYNSEHCRHKILVGSRTRGLNTAHTVFSAAGTGYAFPGLKRPRRKADHLPPSIAKVTYALVCYIYPTKQKGSRTWVERERALTKGNSARSFRLKKKGGRPLWANYILDCPKWLCATVWIIHSEETVVLMFDVTVSHGRLLAGLREPGRWCTFAFRVIFICIIMFLCLSPQIRWNFRETWYEEQAISS